MMLLFLLLLSLQHVIGDRLWKWLRDYDKYLCKYFTRRLSCMRTLIYQVVATSTGTYIEAQSSSTGISGRQTFLVYRFLIQSSQVLTKRKYRKTHYPNKLNLYKYSPLLICLGVCKLYTQSIHLQIKTINHTGSRVSYAKWHRIFTYMIVFGSKIWSMYHIIMIMK